MTAGASAINVRSNLVVNATGIRRGLLAVFFGFARVRIVRDISLIFCKNEPIFGKFDFFELKN